MKELKVTTPADDGHYHIVYLNSDPAMESEGSGAPPPPDPSIAPPGSSAPMQNGAYGGMSPGPDGHVHDLIYDPPRPPTPPTVIDPNTGQPMVDGNGQPVDPSTIPPEMQGQVQIQPGDPGKEVGEWIVRPAGNPIHDHELVEYRTKDTTTKETSKEVLDDCLALWREALSITSDCREAGRVSEDFYKGKQWEEGTERWLSGLDRAALTINEIGPAIDTLRGYQMEQRTDIKFLPQEGGDQRVADMLNVITKRILDTCYYQREESKVFKDQIVPGFGCFNIYMNFLDNIQGDVIVERFPWDSIVYGPHEKEDLSDCEYEVRDRMMSIAKLKQLYGKKAKEIEGSFRAFGGQYPDSERNNNGVAGEHTDYRYAKKVDDISYTVDGTLPLVDVQKKQFRLVQVTRKMYKEVTVLFNEAENFFFTAYDWKDKDIAAGSTIPGFQVISQIKTRMRITKFCGGVVLSDENPADLPIHDFYTVPVYGYRQNGEYWGKVEAAKDPQRELNKRRSQAMDTMNRLGASVYYVEPETFIDRNELERFKKKRSAPGSIFTVHDAGRTPKLEEGAQFPAPLVEIMQLDQQNLQRLMNIVVEQASSDESGAMFLEKKKSRLTGNQFLFDNLSFAKQKIGKILLGLIQRYYPAERLERLLNSQYSKAKFEVGGQDFAQFSKEEVLEMLENADLLQYDVIVSESSFAPSTRLGIAMALFDLIQKGASVPPELPLQFIDMPADIRANITQSLQQQTQQAVQEADTTSKAEIIKTLIAKGQYTVTPEKAQELGLVPTNELQQTSEPANNASNDSSQEDQYAQNLASSLSG